MRQLFIGLIAEGNTDVRFLKNVIFNSVQALSWDCESQVEIFDVREISAKGEGFVEKMLNAAHVASEEFGLSMLCIHADSDHRTIQSVMENKFDPFFAELEKMDEKSYCKHIVPTIPIQEIESWMMADKELLKQLMNASGKRDAELGLEKSPESYSDPKAAIENAIRLSMLAAPKKRRDQITISDFYETLGNRVSLEKLRTIPSFNHFEREVVRVFREIGLMR